MKYGINCAKLRAHKKVDPLTKVLRIDICLRVPLYVANVIKRATRIAVLAPAMIALVYGSALPTHNRGDAGNVNQANLPGLDQWKSIGPDAAISALAIDPANPKVIYAGDDSGVLFKTMDDGATWTRRKVAWGYTRILTIDFVNPSNVYAGTQAGLYKSTDGGATWSNQGNPPASFVVMDPQSPDTLYASSTLSSWKTIDGGASWAMLPTGDLQLYSFGWAISPSQPLTLYAPGNNRGNRALYKSTDGGKSWIATGLANKSVDATAIDPSNPDVVYVSFADGFFFKVFKSTDGGANWFDSSDGLDLFPNSQITSIALSPTDPKNLYVGTFNYDEGNGVFRSANSGANWSEFNQGLNYPYINQLVIDSSSKNLYAATFEGVYRYQFSGSCAASQISPTSQSFSSTGGAASVVFTAGSDCNWMIESNADWIRLTSESSGGGSGTVSYAVAPNDSTATRIARISIAGWVLKVTQAGVPVRINGAVVEGKRLVVSGENFDAGAVILINGEEQKTKPDPNSQTTLIGKKARKKIQAGDRLQVRNPNGSVSEEFIFTGA